MTENAIFLENVTFSLKCYKIFTHSSKTINNTSKQPFYFDNIFYFQNCSNFLWHCSDAEELVFQPIHCSFVKLANASWECIHFLAALSNLTVHEQSLTIYYFVSNLLKLVSKMYSVVYKKTKKIIKIQIYFMYDYRDNNFSEVISDFTTLLIILPNEYTTTILQKTFYSTVKCNWRTSLEIQINHCKTYNVNY